MSTILHNQSKASSGNEASHKSSDNKQIRINEKKYYSGQPPMGDKNK